MVQSRIDSGASRELSPLAPQGDQLLLWEGVETVADVDLVAMLLGARSRAGPSARRLLERLGGLEGLGRAGPAALMAQPGLGTARAWRVSACIEIGRRLQRRAARPRERLDTPAAVARCMGPRLASLDHEQIWVLSLDGAHGLRGMRCVARGGQHGCSISAREILRAAVADGASGFVLVHNHPSGEATPSPDDLAMTHAVVRAAEVVGIPLIDHVIVTPAGAHTSLLEQGEL